MAQTPAKIGIIGCGRISETYLSYAKRFDAFDVIAVADTRLHAAQSWAKEYEVIGRHR